MSRALPVLDCNTFFGFWPKAAMDFSPDRLLADVGTVPGSRALTLSLSGVFLEHVRGNRETLEACAREACLLPVATVGLNYYCDLRTEAPRLKGEGFVAIRILNEIRPLPIAFEPLRGLMSAMRGLGLPLIISAEQAGEATAIGDLVCGSGIPTILVGVNYSAHGSAGEALHVARRVPEIYLETSRFDSAGMIERFVEVLGVERLVFGSGAPRQYFKSAYQVVVTSELSEAEKKKVLYENLAGLVGQVR